MDFNNIKIVSASYKEDGLSCDDYNPTELEFIFVLNEQIFIAKCIGRDILEPFSYNVLKNLNFYTYGKRTVMEEDGKENDVSYWTYFSNYFTYDDCICIMKSILSTHYIPVELHQLIKKSTINDKCVEYIESSHGKLPTTNLFYKYKGKGSIQSGKKISEMAPTELQLLNDLVLNPKITIWTSMFPPVEHRALK